MSKINENVNSQKSLFQVVKVPSDTCRPTRLLPKIGWFFLPCIFMMNFPVPDVLIVFVYM